MAETATWPYPNESNQSCAFQADVIVLGAGISGCLAAIAAAKAGQSVIVVEKSGAVRSGAGGSGCDHWEQCATNPCSTVSPLAMQQALMDYTSGYNNAISHYIEAREGWDRLLDLEAMGAKIRDTDDIYAGADFRDEASKLLFAYDYQSRTTLRIWGTTFKPALIKEMRRLKINIIEHVAITSLLTQQGKIGSPCIGATGISSRSGKFYTFNGKAVVMALSRPARLWLFSAAYPGLCEFRPLSCNGSGHAIGWRIGAKFTMMEKSVTGEFSAAGKSFPPYGSGNNHNTWYPATLIDARGQAIPYVDRDGNVLTDFRSRCLPVGDQAFFLKGGNIDKPYYPYDGPETLDYQKLQALGYKLPFYADLSDLPSQERAIIWGMMVGEEGKTRVPILDNYQALGFDPKRHVLQCYGEGWKSGSFLPQERQLFGLTGGFFNDWHLMSSIPGLFVCGDALFSSNCYGHAATTGHYAGRHASQYAATHPSFVTLDSQQINSEQQRLSGFLKPELANCYSWKELNQAIAKTMQNYCGAIKEDGLLKAGLQVLQEYETAIVPQCAAANPHELVRLLEVCDILTVAQIVLQSCLARKSDCDPLEFYRSDNRGETEALIIINHDGHSVNTEHLCCDYAGDVEANYQKYNTEYINERGDFPE